MIKNVEDKSIALQCHYCDSIHSYHESEVDSWSEDISMVELIEYDAVTCPTCQTIIPIPCKGSDVYRMMELESKIQILSDTVESLTSDMNKMNRRFRHETGSM